MTGCCAPLRTPLTPCWGGYHDRLQCWMDDVNYYLRPRGQCVLLQTFRTDGKGGARAPPETLNRDRRLHDYSRSLTVLSIALTPDECKRLTAEGWSPGFRKNSAMMDVGRIV